MYEVPGPEEIRAFMKKNNLTGADVAALTGVKPRAARRWVVPAGHKDNRSIPWAAWTLMVLLTGDQSKDEILRQIEDWKVEKTGRKLHERSSAERPPANED